MNAVEQEIVDYLSSTRWEEIPADVIEIARCSIVDALGVCLAGSAGEDIEKLVDWLGRDGVSGPSKVLLHDIVLPPERAAWANGAMARAREFDDSHDPTGDHSSVPAFAAAMAVSQSCAPISGRRLLVAYVLGVEVTARLRSATTRKVGGTAFAANSYAPITAAVVAAKMMDLHGREMYDAIAWACSQMAGSVQLQQGGSSALHIHHGMAAANGVASAMMAQRGFQGMEDCISGKFGLYNAYEGGQYDPGVVTRGLGTEFSVRDLGVKRFPSGRVTHGPVEAALELHQAGEFSPDQIERVEVAYTAGGVNMTCEPDEHRRTPTSVQHAKFSLYYNVACALVRGHVDLSDFTPSAVQDERVRTLTQKVRADVSAAGVIPLGAVTVVLRDGKRISNDGVRLRGAAGDRLTFDECAEKARYCARFASSPVRLDVLEDVITSLASLEDVDDAGALFGTDLR